MNKTKLNINKKILWASVALLLLVTDYLIEPPIYTENSSGYMTDSESVLQDTPFIRIDIDGNSSKHKLYIDYSCANGRYTECWGDIQIRNKEGTVVFDDNFDSPVCNSCNNRLIALTFVDIDFDDTKEMFITRGTGFWESGSGPMEVYKLSNGKYIKVSSSILEIPALLYIKGKLSSHFVHNMTTLLSLFLLVPLFIIFAIIAFATKSQTVYWLILFPIFVLISGLIVIGLSFLLMFSYLIFAALGVLLTKPESKSRDKELETTNKKPESKYRDGELETMHRYIAVLIMMVLILILDLRN
jgi:hypothetical protein